MYPGYQLLGLPPVTRKTYRSGCRQQGSGQLLGRQLQLVLDSGFRTVSEQKTSTNGLADTLARPREFLMPL